MAFVSVFCLFSVALVVRDIVIESADRRRDRKKTETQNETSRQTPAEAETESEAEVQTAPSEQLEEESGEAEKESEPVEKAEGDGNEVTFSLGSNETLEEKYLSLPAEYKLYYDEIVKHAAIQEGAKHAKTARYEEFKIGNTRLVRLCIKKGIVVCEFILYNSDFRRLHKELKVNVKQAPTVVKVTDAEIVQMAKDSIDIAVRAIAEEKAYKKELANERRRQQRAEKKRAEQEATEEAAQPATPV